MLTAQRRVDTADSIFSNENHKFFKDKNFNQKIKIVVNPTKKNQFYPNVNQNTRDYHVPIINLRSYYGTNSEKKCCNNKKVYISAWCLLEFCLSEMHANAMLIL